MRARLPAEGTLVSPTIGLSAEDTHVSLTRERSAENSPALLALGIYAPKPKSRRDGTPLHSFHHLLVHVVFSTKNREPFLTPKIRARLWPYLGGIARENDMRAIAVGGMFDHVHILLSMPATLAVAKAIQVLKGNSSKWLHETFSETRNSSWQAGYGAFSIGVSGVDDTVHYIETQEEHHRVRTFREEFESFLRRHGVPFETVMLD